MWDYLEWVEQVIKIKNNFCWNAFQNGTFDEQNLILKGIKNSTTSGIYQKTE